MDALTATLPALARKTFRRTNSLEIPFPAKPASVDAQIKPGETDGMLNGIAQATGLIDGDQTILSSLIPKPTKVSLQQVWDDPSLATDAAWETAYSWAEGQAKKELEARLKKLAQNWALSAIGEGKTDKVLEDPILCAPDPTILGDLGDWAQKQWDKYTSMEYLTGLGADKAIDFAEDKMMEAFGLDELADSDPASAHIAAKLLESYLLPELKEYAKQQALSFLKDQFPISLKKLDVGEQKDILSRIEEGLGVEGDAGCVPIAIRYDIGDHGGAITTPCATTVVVGDVEIPVARMGDGFTCPVHLRSNPVAEGIPNVLVEGLPITAHKLSTTCGARILGSAWHNVYVADLHPEIFLPQNPTQSCPADPSGGAAAGSDASGQAADPSSNGSGAAAADSNTGSGQQGSTNSPSESDRLQAERARLQQQVLNTNDEAAKARLQEVESRIEALNQQRYDELKSKDAATLSNRERKELGELQDYERPVPRPELQETPRPIDVPPKPSPVPTPEPPKSDPPIVEPPPKPRKPPITFDTEVDDEHASAVFENRLGDRIEGSVNWSEGNATLGFSANMFGYVVGSKGTLSIHFDWGKGRLGISLEPSIVFEGEEIPLELPGKH